MQETASALPDWGLGNCGDNAGGFVDINEFFKLISLQSLQDIARDEKERMVKRQEEAERERVSAACYNLSVNCIGQNILKCRL